MRSFAAGLLTASALFAGAIAIVGGPEGPPEVLDLRNRWVTVDHYDQWQRELAQRGLSQYYIPLCESTYHLPDAPAGMVGKFIPCLG